LPLTEGGARRRAAAGVVPDNVTEAIVTLMLPGGSAVTTDELVLRTAVASDVPISIYAESPGTLTVSQFRIVTDKAPPRPPTPPAHGFCPPTKPGKEPGGEDCDYCVSCGVDRPMRKRTDVARDGARVAAIVDCAVCGGTHARHGRTASRPGRAITLPRFAIGPRVEHVATVAPSVSRLHFRRGRLLRRHASAPVAELSLAPAGIPLSRLSALGARERQALDKAGITSVEQLAIAEAQALADILPSGSRARAQMLIGLAGKWLERESES
jgi:hypothetical protein